MNLVGDDGFRVRVGLGFVFDNLACFFGFVWLLGLLTRLDGGRSEPHTRMSSAADLAGSSSRGRAWGSSPISISRSMAVVGWSGGRGSNFGVRYSEVEVADARALCRLVFGSASNRREKSRLMIYIGRVVEAQAVG